MISIGNVLLDREGFAFRVVSIRKYNHHHDAHGRFASGDGYESDAEAAQPRTGSKKAKVFETYKRYGKSAASEHARALGLAPGTANSWTSTWGRQGTPPGTETGFRPPGPAVPFTPPTRPAPPVPRPSPTGRIDGTQRTLSVRPASGGPEHRADVERGVAAIPAAHQEALARSGLQISSVDVPRTRNALGVHYHMPNTTGNGRIEVGKFSSGSGSLSRLRNTDVVGTTVHELGHAIDHTSNWRHSEALARHVDEDARAMSEQDRQYARYYFSNNKERFAELYRTAYSPGRSAFGMTTSRARRVFANSIAKMKELIG